MIVEGKASKEIAVLLNLGMETVRSCRKSMMKKLGVNNVRSHQGRRSPASPADPADNTGNVETIWIGRAIGREIDLGHRGLPSYVAFTCH